ncbi:MAG: hypothetical protein KC800_29755, partial [Candidatus Eremiobacteraeota bacterium]|nr:hypothetical protein [Candidatus Eremiobacteraeota bacterium]
MEIQREKVLGLLLAGLLTSGCGNSTSETAIVGTSPVPASQFTFEEDPTPPVAFDDLVSALGNATLNQSAQNGVLANDLVYGGTISSFDSTGSQGGTLTLQSDGGFTYTPILGFVGTETFKYTLSNSDGDSTATLTLVSTGRGIFVDNTVGGGGDGSQTNPLNNLADAIAQSLSGDTIYVSAGDGLATGLSGNFTLPQGVDLAGEGAGLILGQTIESPGTPPILDGKLTLSGDNKVSGITFIGSEVTGSSISDIAIVENTFRNVDGTDSIELVDVAGQVVIQGNEFFQDNDVDSIYLTTFTNPASLDISGNEFGLISPGANGDDAIQVFVNGNSVTTAVVRDNVMNGGTGMERALLLEANDQSRCTYIAENNTGSGFSYRAIDVGSQESAIIESAVFRNNVLENGNVGLYVRCISTSQATIVAEMTVLTDASNQAVGVQVVDQASLALALRQNDLSNSGAEAAEGGGSRCRQVGRGNAVIRIDHGVRLRQFELGQGIAIRRDDGH